MEFETASVVAEWLHCHQEHLPDAVGSTPAELLFEFLSDPTRLIEYPDPQSADLGTRVLGGCNYQFQRGAFAGDICGRKKCQFHKHVIFSNEYQRGISIFHEKINAAARHITYPEIQTKYLGNGRYLEQGHGLVIRVDNHRRYCCEGYMRTDTEFATLTPGLIKYCESRGILHTPYVDCDSQ